jgi:hypothetical protein
VTHIRTSSSLTHTSVTTFERFHAFDQPAMLFSDSVDIRDEE